MGFRCYLRRAGDGRIRIREKVIVRKMPGGFIKCGSSSDVYHDEAHEKNSLDGACFSLPFLDVFLTIRSYDAMDNLSFFKGKDAPPPPRSLSPTVLIP